MKISQIAAQLYTLRDYLKTPEDIAATLKKVRAIGYEAVQLSGLGKVDDDEVLRILQGEGLVCCATHEPADKILENPQQVVERLQKFNCRHTAYPFPAGIKMDDPAAVSLLARKLDAAGAVLREANQLLSYHNHAIEWVRVDDKLAIEKILDETSPLNLHFELDTYWVQFGGGDPVDWCHRATGRLSIIHLKDYAFTAENNPTMAEIGRGNLNFKKIIPAAEDAGCEWFIVEQDVCPGDPIDSLRISFEYLRDHCG